MELTIGLISALVGMVLGYAGFLRTRDKDVANRAAESAVMTAKLDHIGQGVDQIRIDQRTTDVRLSGLDGRLISVEKDVQSTKEGLQAVSERVEKIVSDRT